MDFKTWLDLERLRASWTSMLVFLHIGGMHYPTEATAVDPGMVSSHDAHGEAFQGDGHSPFADFSDHGSAGGDNS